MRYPFPCAVMHFKLCLCAALPAETTGASAGAVASTSTNGAFVFVESVLVRALSAGDWVLLDNANSCPPEVLERLNSLLEQDRMLNVYESGQGREFRDTKGGEGLGEGECIHADFRIFATANTKRVHSNKMSGAFLNRMVRIWLPDVDSNPQLLEIVQQSLAGIHGGREVADVAIKFHQV
jgi:midasin (ATPase involved in ribosome maturation)